MMNEILTLILIFITITLSIITYKNHQEKLALKKEIVRLNHKWITAQNKIRQIEYKKSKPGWVSEGLWIDVHHGGH